MKRIAIAAAAALMISAPAFAASDTFRFNVEFTPAKLSTPDGASAEYDRITRQVSERCAAEHRSSGMSKVFETYAADICTRQTLNRVVRQVGHPALTEIHDARRAGN